MKTLMMSLAVIASPLAAIGADMSNGADNFYKSDKVTVQKGHLQEPIPDDGGGESFRSQKP